MCNAPASHKMKKKTIFSNTHPAKWTLQWMSTGKVNFQLSVVWYYLPFLKKNIMLVNSEDTPNSVASDLGLHCLSLSRKNNARLLWANVYSCVIKEGFVFIWTLITCID